ncbi:hypothetical protein ACSQ67_025052 [Phaseolus vulgaris]
MLDPVRETTTKPSKVIVRSHCSPLQPRRHRAVKGAITTAPTTNRRARVSILILNAEPSRGQPRHHCRHYGRRRWTSGGWLAVPLMGS